MADEDPQTQMLRAVSCEETIEEMRVRLRTQAREKFFTMCGGDLEFFEKVFLQALHEMICNHAHDPKHDQQLLFMHPFKAHQPETMRIIVRVPRSR